MKPSSLNFSSKDSVERKLLRARSQMLLMQPFFGSLCLHMKLSPGPVPTMTTDGKRILYNPGFVDSLTPAEIEGTLAHEVMHVALAHHCRRGEFRRIKCPKESFRCAGDISCWAGNAHVNLVCRVRLFNSARDIGLC